jgi:hypothetical protein
VRNAGPGCQFMIRLPLAAGPGNGPTIVATGPGEARQAGAGQAAGR